MRGIDSGPAAIAGVVDRPRLYQVLDSQWVRICVIQGPSGSGKTTLVRSWLQRQADPGRVLWVSVNDSLTSRQSFSHQVANAAARAGVISEDKLEWSRSQLGVSSDPVQVALTALAGSEPFTVVIDAYENVGEARAQIDIDLERIVRAAPNLRIIVTTRGTTGLAYADPPGGVTRVLTIGELALTGGEVRALIAAQTGIDDERLAESVTAATRGFPLAVRAVVLTLAQLGTVPQVDSAEWNSVIAARLESLLPDRVAAQFVTDTSVPPYVDEELAQRLSGRADTAALLEMLERTGFGRWIPYSRQRSVFQYVDTIRETFRTRAQHDPERFRHLCTTTAQWLLENNELVEQALQFAIKGGDYALADRVFVSVVVASPDSYITDRFLPTLREVPEEVLDQYPMLAFALALSLAANAMLRGLSGHAARIAYESSATPDYVEPSVDAFALAGMRAVARRVARDYQDSARAAREALLMLDDLDPHLQAKHGELIGTVVRQLSYSLFQGGSISEALAAVDRSVALCPTQTTRNYSAVYAAGICAFAGDMQRARLVSATIDTNAWPGELRNSYLNGPGLIAEGYRLLDALDFAGAAEHLRTAVPFNRTAEFWPFFAGISISARHGLGQAHAEAVRMGTELAEAVPRPGVGDNIATERLYASLALAWIASNDHRKAAQALDPVRSDSLYAAAARVALPLAEGRTEEALRRTEELLDLPGHTIRTRAELHTYGAVAALREGSTEQAWTWLNAAAIAWESYGPRMHVALLTPSDRRLLAELGEERESASIRSYLDVPAPSARTSASLPVPLTARESVVLTALAEHQGIRAIADALVVSPHTVKSQLQSIYRKLGVSSGQSALTVAREMGLLRQPPG